MDEVVCGFGRTGKWFGCNHWKVVPDIITLDKGISSGYLPLSAVVVKKEIAAKFIGTPRDAFPHGHTWWGHPVCCAIGLANIDIIEREKLVENSAKIGAYFLDGLRSALIQSPIVGNIQGLGLLLGIELVKNKKTKERFAGKESGELMSRLNNKLLKYGLIAQVSSLFVLLVPPLIIKKAEVDEIIGILEKSIRETEREMSPV
jgi:putrescine aminotransferase